MDIRAHDAILGDSACGRSHFAESAARTGQSRPGLPKYLGVLRPGEFCRFGWAESRTELFLLEPIRFKWWKRVTGWAAQWHVRPYHRSSQPEHHRWRRGRTHPDFRFQRELQKLFRRPRSKLRNL